MREAYDHADCRVEYKPESEKNVRGFRRVLDLCEVWLKVPPFQEL